MEDLDHPVNFAAEEPEHPPNLVHDVGLQTLEQRLGKLNTVFDRLVDRMTAIDERCERHAAAVRHRRDAVDALAAVRHRGDAKALHVLAYSVQHFFMVLQNFLTLAAGVDSNVASQKIHLRKVLANQHPSHDNITPGLHATLRATLIERFDLSEDRLEYLRELGEICCCGPRGGATSTWRPLAIEVQDALHLVEDIVRSEALLGVFTLCLRYALDPGSRREQTEDSQTCPGMQSASSSTANESISVDQIGASYVEKTSL